jgi:predicted nucleotide-binding protein (sugar kinase/HSP70/actin superfamily)
MSEIKNTEYRGYTAFFGNADRRRTVLIPWFTDFLSPFIPAIAKLAGYNFVNCPKTSKTSADIGLTYGNNEVCYPATLILGDLIAEIKTGKYDLDNLAVAITQTGGQCRATNYIAMIKAGLKSAGYGSVPVIAVSLGGALQNEQSGFKLPVFKILNVSVNAFFFGDMLNRIFAYHVVREKEKGQSQQIFDRFMQRGVEIILENRAKKFLPLLDEAVVAFNAIEIHEKECMKVGLVGEIFVKYNNFGQAHVTEYLREKGVEVLTPSMIEFFTQAFVNNTVNIKNGIARTSKIRQKLMPLFYKVVNRRLQKFEKILSQSRAYEPHRSIFDVAAKAERILDLSNQFGEGWMIAGEVANFAERGVNRVVCVQPFGCIANHVVAKGIEKRLKKFYPSLNLLFLDIDGGMAEVNLQNRLEFLVG